MPCIHCAVLSTLEPEYPDAPHHGALLTCDKCKAEYYAEYERDIYATNDQAKASHPELKQI